MVFSNDVLKMIFCAISYFWLKLEKIMLHTVIKTLRTVLSLERKSHCTRKSLEKKSHPTLSNFTSLIFTR